MRELGHFPSGELARGVRPFGHDALARLPRAGAAAA
jgi:hypothetical protein